MDLSFFGGIKGSEKCRTATPYRQKRNKKKTTDFVDTIIPDFYVTYASA